ncbi:MAG: lytic transglycosylase domain-containing protein [Bryobacteraceae bacterium]
MLTFCCALAAAAATPEPNGHDRVRAVSTVRADPRTGRLVRATVYRTAKGKPVPAAEALRPLVELAAREHGVDPGLVDAVIGVESSYNPAAVSPKGAAGLMQLMPATARALGARNRFDLHENLLAGVRYLRALKEQFGDDRLALAAYNAGEGAVKRHRGVPPYPETLEYVRKVEQRYRRGRGSSHEESTEAPTAETEPTRRLLVEADAEGKLYLRTR